MKSKAILIVLSLAMLLSGSCRQPQEQKVIIMEASDSDAASDDTDRFEDDSLYAICIAKSDKTLLASNVAERNIVADSLSAVMIAQAAWFPLYGREDIERQRPYIVSQSRKYWFVEGSQPPMTEGGTAHITIRKSDGKVMHVWHEK